MKAFTIHLTWVFACAALLMHAQIAPDTLTNEKIIQLCKIGLEPSVVLSKMQNSVNVFDVSTDGLISLSNNGVPAEVINEMMKIDAEINAAVANQKDMRDPLSMRAPGIYYFDPTDADKPLKRVDPTVISSNKVSSGGISISGPLLSTSPTEKMKSTISGPNSRFEITETNPVFYFYFEKNDNSNSDNWFFAMATSPNEFALVKLTQKNKYREMLVASANAYHESYGVSEKAKVPFDYTEEAEGIYKIFFKQPLKIGEYCFLYASTIPNRYSNDKVFDFGIQVTD